MKINRYVAGLLSWENHIGVVKSHLFVEKLKPEWQKGLLNFIGGKVEDNESATDAMIREFYEETKREVLDWHLFCDERGSDYIVSFFRARVRGAEGSAPPQIPEKNDAGEFLCWRSPEYVALNRLGFVGNCNWLIPMAMDWRKMFTEALVVDDIAHRPYW